MRNVFTYRLLLLAALAFTGTIITSCKKDKNIKGPAGDNPLGVDVYTAGYINELRPVAAYWKNDNVTELGLGEATGIALKGNNVYVVGYSSAANGAAVATYWKNGIRTVLADSTHSSKATGITISGNDVYISGTIDHPSSPLPLAVYWKNGNLNTLGDVNANTISSTASGITVQNNDVYVAGNMNVSNGALHAVYWKNGQVVTLNSGSDEFSSQLFSLTINGNDVYAAGRVVGILTPNEPSFVSAYWKNGVPTFFTDGGAFSVANGVLVKGNDVYVIGSKTISGDKTIAGYWKNGVFTTLGDGVGASEANAFALQGDDIYTGGRSSTPVYTYACYWKNGAPVQLATESSGVFGIAVVKGND